MTAPPRLTSHMGKAHQHLWRYVYAVSCFIVQEGETESLSLVRHSLWGDSSSPARGSDAAVRTATQMNWIHYFPSAPVLLCIGSTQVKDSLLNNDCAEARFFLLYAHQYTGTRLLHRKNPQPSTRAEAVAAAHRPVGALAMLGSQHQHHQFTDWLHAQTQSALGPRRPTLEQRVCRPIP